MNKKMKEKIAAFIFLVTFVPPTLKYLLFDVRSGNIDGLSSYLEAVLIPWWINPIQFLSSFEGIIGSLITLAFIGFLIWIGEIGGK